MYCMKCKRYTTTKEHRATTTKKNQIMLAGNCQVCGTKKRQFATKETIRQVMEDESRSDNEQDPPHDEL